MFYSGGGYVQTLGTSYNETLALIMSLETEGWLDLSSRVVMIEFSLYHPSADLTSYVTLIIEFSISGKTSIYFLYIQDTHNVLIIKSTNNL